jgi:hypothetical protein
MAIPLPSDPSVLVGIAFAVLVTAAAVLAPRLLARRPAAPVAEKPDADRLATLRERVADPDSPRRIEFYLFFPARESAEGSLTPLRSAGYEVDTRTPASRERDILIVASREMPLDLGMLTRCRREVAGIAAVFGGTFDGWDAGEAEGGA